MILKSLGVRMLFYSIAMQLLLLCAHSVCTVTWHPIIDLSERIIAGGYSQTCSFHDVFHILACNLNIKHYVCVFLGVHRLLSS